MPEEICVIQTQPLQQQQLQAQALADPLSTLLLFPFILLNGLFISMLNMQRLLLQQQLMMSSISIMPQQTFVKITYDDKGNITSIYERKF